MNIILVGKRGERMRTVTVTRTAVTLVSLLAFVITPSLLVFGGYWMAQKVAPSQDELLMSAWQQEMQSQREEIADVQRQARENMDALALRLGELQAKVIRLDALGERLTAGNGFRPRGDASAGFRPVARYAFPPAG